LFYSIEENGGGPGSIVDGVAEPAASFDVTLGDTTSVTIDPIPGTDLAKYAAIEIIQKYWRNEETPYIIGYEISWTSYYYTPQYLNPGGYIEDPVLEATPQLPSDCWQVINGDGSTGEIFDMMANWNPQCYSEDGTITGDTAISWLRKADDVDQTQRTWIKILRTWMGTPIGHWDFDLYNWNDAPWSDGDNIDSYSTIGVPDIKKADVAAANISGLVVTPTS
jgi:hypothetical protein